MTHVYQGNQLRYLDQKSQDILYDQIMPELEDESQLVSLNKGQKYQAGLYAAPFEGAYYRARIEIGKDCLIQILCTNQTLSWRCILWIMETQKNVLEKM